MKPIIKVLVFIALLGCFWAVGGFSRPRLARDGYRDPVRVDRAWNYTMIMFVVGAGIAVWGDKTVGILDPISFRAVFITLGVLLMLAGLLWVRMLKSTYKAAAHRSNPGMQQTVTSRFAQCQWPPQWRLAPAADAERSTWFYVGAIDRPSSPELPAEAVA